MTLQLHYWPTPNGKKITIFLEEAEIPYTIVPCNIGRGDQFAGDFPKLNPNTRMPLLVDDEPLGGGAPISVFESGAILLYLAEKTGKFWPQAPREKYDVVQWIIWQMANQGPKLGEFGHFKRLGDSKGDQSYAVRRFSDETNRLYGVLNNRLTTAATWRAIPTPSPTSSPIPGQSTGKARIRTSKNFRISNAGSRN
jgi:GST-like protein